MKQGWIFIHGIGYVTSEGYSSKYQDYIKQIFPEAIMEELHWEHFIKDNEQYVYERCGSNLGYKLLRKLAFIAGDDAILYHFGSSVYNNIHKELSDLVQTMVNQGVDQLYLVGHSLGSVIIANFLWDAIQDSGPSELFSLDFDQKDYLKQNLCGVGYIASPISLWSAKFKEGGRCTDYNMFQSLKSACNIYSKYDVIAWPQRCINKTFSDQVKLVDMKLNYGPLWWRFTPLSHVKAWNDTRIPQALLQEFGLK